MNVGIFWVYAGQVFGALTPLSEAELGIPGMLDSPQNHVDAWPRVRRFLPQHLRDGEYFEIPRGRVLYSTTGLRAIVYMDATLHKKNIKAKVSKYFDLDQTKTSWRFDDHYTTSSTNLDDLFGEMDE